MSAAPEGEGDAAPAQDAPTSEEHDGSAPEVTKESFFARFRAEEQSIREDLGAVSAGAGSDQIHEALDALLARDRSLEEAFTRIVHLLPPYDVQQYRASLKALAADIAARREQLAPRRKFQFRRKAATASAEPAAAGAPTGGAAPQNPTAQAGPQCENDGAPSAVFDGELFEGLSSALVSRCAGELAGRDVTLRGLDGCRVTLLDRVGALHCHGLRRCEVVVGAVASSALLYNCQECVITLAAKQLRLHDSEQILLHLSTLSGPVIEHSRRILFAPHDVSYPGLDLHLEAAELPPLPVSESGVWSQVQDFNWHKRQASPNWRVVPAELRRQPPQLPGSDEEPALAELERCRGCWEAVEAEATGHARAAPPPPPAAPAPGTPAAAGPPGRLSEEDEF